MTKPWLNLSILVGVALMLTTTAWANGRAVEDAVTLFRHIEAVNNFNTCARLARVEQAIRA